MTGVQTCALPIFGLNGIWVAVLVSHIVASLAATMTGTVLIRKKGNIKA